MGELLRFSREDIVDLAARLSQVLKDLSEGEQRLLLAILEVAAEHAYEPVPAPPDEVKELREQIIRSFVPEDKREFFLDTRNSPPKIGPPWRMGIPPE